MTAPPPPSAPRDPAPAARDGERDLWLSALADGERDALVPAQAHWREDPRARERWHLYHLIGDVMRSDDLASRPERDAAFVARLRERLADEPVPLAPVTSVPVPVPASAHAAARRLGWRAPAAVAAGFVAVAATLVLVRPEAIGLTGPEGGAPWAAVSGRQAAPSPSGELLVDGQMMIRDARLDAYLQAHRTMGGGPAAALPGGGLIRRVDHAAAIVPPALPVPVVPAVAASPSVSSPASGAVIPAAAPR